MEQITSLIDSLRVNIRDDSVVDAAGGNPRNDPATVVF